MTQLQKMIMKMREKMTLLDLRKVVMHISGDSCLQLGSKSAAGVSYADQDLELEGSTFDCGHSNSFLKTIKYANGTD